MQVKCCNICINSNRLCNPYEKYLAHGNRLANVSLLSAQCIKRDIKALLRSAGQIWSGEFQSWCSADFGSGFLQKPGASSSLRAQFVLVRLSWNSDWQAQWRCDLSQIAWQLVYPWQWFQSGSIQPFETDNLRLLLISLCLILFYIPTDKYII